VLVEVPAAIRGHAVPRVRLLGPIQPAVGRLVAVVIVGTLAALPAKFDDHLSRDSLIADRGRSLLAVRLISAVWPGEGLRSMLLWSRQPNRAARSVAATSTTCDRSLRTPMTFSSNVVELIDPTT
jgi:hypothetical protein